MYLIKHKHVFVLIVEIKKNKPKKEIRRITN